MDVTITEAMTTKMVETRDYLTETMSRWDQVNDRAEYATAVHWLNELAVAITQAQAPAGSFLATGPVNGPYFTTGRESSVTKALEAAVTVLQDPDVAETVATSKGLSSYAVDRTTGIIDRLKRLYHTTLASVRDNAQRDLAAMMEGDVAYFLSAAEVTRTWKLGMPSD